MEEGQWWRHCSDREDLSSVSSGRDQHLLLNSAAHCPVSFKVFKVCTEIYAHSSFTCGWHQALHTAEITTILPLHNCTKNLTNYNKSGSGKYQKLQYLKGIFWSEVRTLNRISYRLHYQCFLKNFWTCREWQNDINLSRRRQQFQTGATFNLFCSTVLHFWSLLNCSSHFWSLLNCSSL